MVAIVALGAFFMFKGKTSPSSTNQSNNSTTPVNSSIQTSFKSLLAGGTSQKCTFNDRSTTDATQGTVYVTTGHFRGDFSSVADGKTQQIHMISDGQMSNMWFNGQTTGYKTKFDSSASASSQSKGPDTNKDMNFNCSAWSVDSSLFTLPTDVKFTDLTSVATPSASPTTPNPSILQACASLSEPARTQCMNSYQ